MNNKIYLFLLMAFFLSLSNYNLFADFDVDEFICPADQKPEKAEESRKIKNEVKTVDKDTIKAKSLNDACNYALKQTDKDTVTLLEIPNGHAILSRASEVYNVYPNPDATTSSKRDAFIRAYTKSKTQMISFLDGKNIKASDIFETDSQSSQTENVNKINYKNSNKENIETAVNGYLKSHVIYDMGEKDGEVWVAIVASQKTKNIWFRESDNCFTAASMKEGLTKAFTEIQKGIIPLGGAKIINCKDTDGFVLMGFGSSQVMHYKNINAQRQSDKSSKEKAQIRAETELIKAIKGEYLSHKNKLIGDTSETGTESDSFYQKFEQTIGKTEFSINGTLPPGVITKVEKTNDGNWFIGVAIWMPATQKYAESMK